MTHFLAYIMLFLFLAATACTGDSGKVAFKPIEAENIIQIYMGNEHFTSLFYPDDLKKPVLYPIYSSSGKEITRGYPYNPRSFERTDHLHHVGLWLNFGDVNGLDFWNHSPNVTPENRHRFGSIRFGGIVRKDPGAGKLVIASDWVDHENNVLLNEETDFVFGEENGIRTIERTSRLTAVEDVTFKGNKEGLLGLRVDKAFEGPDRRERIYLDREGRVMTDRMVQTTGRTGEYRNADGHIGSDVWSERSPWVALRGEIEGEIITIAIFDHHSNPYYPAWSHARSYGLFAVNNLGGKGMRADAEDVEIELRPGESITFTHLVVIGGDMADDELDQRLRDFHR